jgi:hypothetical protein
MLPTWHDALELTALASGAGMIDAQHPLELALIQYGRTARSWR